MEAFTRTVLRSVENLAIEAVLVTSNSESNMFVERNWAYPLTTSPWEPATARSSMVRTIALTSASTRLSYATNGSPNESIKMLGSQKKSQICRPHNLYPNSHINKYTASQQQLEPRWLLQEPSTIPVGNMKTRRCGPHDLAVPMCTSPPPTKTWQPRRQWWYRTFLSKELETKLFLISNKQRCCDVLGL